MLTRNKRRVVLALYHRGRLSLGDNRARFGYEAYHWTILITRKHTHSKCNAYDAADIATLDPTTGDDLNPNRNWVFRAQHDIDPAANGKLIGRVSVGKLPKGTSDDTLDALMQAVVLPKKGVSPPESCVTWAVAGLGSLQDAGFAWKFDLQSFKT